MMIIINRTGDFISGAINGTPFTVAFDQTKYDLMKDLELQASTVATMEELKELITEITPLTKESYKEIVESASPYLFVDKHRNKFFLKYNGVVSKRAVPQPLVDKILESVEKNIDIDPLVKCWVRYLREIPGRPAYSEQRANDFAAYITAQYTDQDKLNKLCSEEGLSIEYATAAATSGQVAISQEGLLVCYKVSRELLTRYDLNEEEEVVQKSRYKKSVDPDTGLVSYDEPEYVEDRVFQPAIMGTRGDEFWSGDKKGHLIRVGNAHWLENWNQVGEPGRKGLHCGGLNYIRGYQQNGTVTHNIFVDPADIHSVNIGYGSDGAMTCKRYFVHSSFAGVNKGIYHSSNYAAMNDQEYQTILEEVVKATQQSKAEMDEMLDEHMALA